MTIFAPAGEARAPSNDDMPDCQVHVAMRACATYGRALTHQRQTRNFNFYFEVKWRTWMSSSSSGLPGFMQNHLAHEFTHAQTYTHRNTHTHVTHVTHVTDVTHVHTHVHTHRCTHALASARMHGTHARHSWHHEDCQSLMPLCAPAAQLACSGPAAMDIVFFCFGPGPLSSIGRLVSSLVASLFLQAGTEFTQQRWLKRLLGGWAGCFCGSP